jgi:hypothetical protein
MVIHPRRDNHLSSAKEKVDVENLANSFAGRLAHRLVRRCVWRSDSKVPDA